MPMIELDYLPTPLAMVVRRLNVCGPENSGADTFLYTSYVAEAAIKMLGVCLAAGLENGAPEHAYRVARTFVQADGLGTWDVRWNPRVRDAVHLPDSLARHFKPSSRGLLPRGRERPTSGIGTPSLTLRT